MLSNKVAQVTSLFRTATSKPYAGWSLLEVLCVVGLMAMAANLWVPAWQLAWHKLTLQQEQQGLLQQLRNAKAWAQANQQAITLSGWQTNKDAIEVVAFVDNNRDRQYQAQEWLLSRQAYSVAMEFSRGSYVRLSALGTTGQSGSWYLCHANLAVGWRLVLSSSGNLRTEVLNCHA